MLGAMPGIAQKQFGTSVRLTPSGWIHLLRRG
jgi:hypothetical protein